MWGRDRELGPLGDDGWKVRHEVERGLPCLWRVETCNTSCTVGIDYDYRKLIFIHTLIDYGGSLINRCAERSTGFIRIAVGLVRGFGSLWQFNVQRSSSTKPPSTKVTSQAQNLRPSTYQLLYEDRRFWVVPPCQEPPPFYCKRIRFRTCHR